MALDDNGPSSNDDDASEAWLQEQLRSERVALMEMLDTQQQKLLTRWRKEREQLKVASARALEASVGAGEQEAAEEPPTKGQATEGAKSPQLAVTVSPSPKSKLSRQSSEGSKASGVIPRSDSALSLADTGLGEGSRFQRFVLGDQFEFLFGSLIMINAIVLAVARQHTGYRTELIMKYGPDYPEVEHNSLDEFFDVLEWIFGSAFLIEFILKVAALRRNIFFYQRFWNMFDAIVALSWVIDRLSLLYVSINPFLLRLTRIVRLMRLVRVLKTFRIFDPLILMMESIKGSMNVLTWAIVLMFMVICTVSMIVAASVEGYLRDQSVPLVKRTEVFLSWGTFSRSVETMFEITLANWGPHCRLLMNNVNQWWMLFFLAFKLVVGFAVVQVIISVFIQQTFKVASRNEEIMVREKQSAAKDYLKKLEALFKRLDASGDGLISRDEFDNAVVNDRSVTHLFGALEVDMKEAERIFDLLDDGDGEISSEEFLRGVSALKGAAKGTDMLALMHETKLNRKFMKLMDAKLDVVTKPQDAEGYASYQLTSTSV